ncbi:MAG: hypothetical protein KIS77_19895 [Saprospiraceae bacterium]|nr:hypothetical protein [Saprospiraceae bacterium]
MQSLLLPCRAADQQPPVPGNPASFDLCYDELIVSLRVATIPSGGLSSVNRVETANCLPIAYQGAWL